ncbi:MAG TPA: lamin tail domain-containing protein, partial [Thermoguttaceae bacterium]|nr:lamin tail domain-containing protein [Thermoguttaceae bacterium]
MFEPLEPRIVLDGWPIINEFMADNETVLEDENGDFPDWIEIYNPTEAAIDLGGWYLTDDPDDLTKWEFPTCMLDPDDYLVVFASDKDRADPGSPLHTNFKLSAGGEYLALVKSDGATVAHQFAPVYPAQMPDVSYGYTHSGKTFVAEGDELAYLVPSAGDAGLGTAWTELDFDDSQWTGNSMSTRILITEVGTTTPSDFIEIQNVRDEPIDTSGWVVALNDGVLRNVNNVNAILWELPDSMAPGEILYRNDSNWGADIVWASSGPNWAMIIDDEGNVVDFIPWKYSTDDLATLDVTINGFPITVGDAWSGTSFNPLGISSGFSFQRQGSSDGNTAADWAVTPVTMGTQSADFITPFVPGIVNGVGFSTGSPSFREAISTDVAEDMLGVNASLWTRVRFDVSDPELFNELTLRVKYNDAFAAYLNGQPIAGRNAPASPQWNSTATAPRDLAQSLVYEEIDVTAFLGALTTGTNVLAVHGLNNNPSDGEFLLVSHLSGTSDAGFLSYMEDPTPGGSNLAGSIASAPEFSQPGGIFTDPFSVTLRADFAPGSTIRYTLDGSIPAETSAEYAGPISINGSTQVRARVFQEGMAPSPAATESYIMLDAGLLNFSSALPLVIIDTFGNSIGSKDGQLHSAYMVVLDRGEDGTTTLTTPIQVETRIGIRTRGSSSAGWPKHHYRIEAWNETSGRIESWSNPDEQELNDKEIAPLGMPPEADWILGSFYQFDRALMRNPLIYELSNQVGRYAARTQHVEVFLNMGGSLSYSDYFGVYTLMEVIERDDSRVDIEPLDPDDNTQPEVSGGYIFKEDRDDTTSSARFTAGGRNLVYVDPDIKELTSQQKTYLSGFINAAYASLIGGTGYVNPNYIDVDAWIDHHWLNLLTKNPDAFRLSGYLYKDREGPIAAGPIWDFDRTMGCDNDTRALIPTGWNPSTPVDDFWMFGWYRYLFQNADFAQRWIDRWVILKEKALSIENIYAVIDAFAAEITQEAANRNFAKWTQNPPDSPGWMGEVNYLKNWLTTRVNWIDSRFLAQAQFGRADGAVEAGTQLTLTGPAGATIYYTFDGSDPRASGGSISANALIYDGTPITLDESKVVTARVWDGVPLRVYSSGPTGGWSAPSEARFIVGTPASADNLAITEINYNPYEPIPAELATQGPGQAPFTNNDFEFIELYNTSDEPIELSGVKFTEGIEFDFVGGNVATLGPHQYAVIAANPQAFAARYGTGINLAGSFTGRLSNQGERLTLRNDWLDETILDFSYDDGGNWPGRSDGKGASLELKVPQETEPEDYDKSGAWQSSVAYGGTPGADAAEPPGVVINEVLTHTDPPNVDWIELHNTTGAEIDVGGWYLSDEWGFHTQPVDEDGDGDLEYDTYKKYRIPPGTKIAAGGYLVVDQTQFDPNGLWNPEAGEPGINEFALDGAHGDDVWLMAADAEGNLTHFVDHVEFEEAANGESFGRWPNAAGALYPMAELTRGQENTGPRIGPIIISEIWHTPAAGEDEFVELYNPTDQDVELFDPTNPASTWQFDGIDYWFPENTVIPAGGV